MQRWNDPLRRADAGYTKLSPVSTGIRGQCPRCGRGRLFSGYLTVAPSCDSCGLDYEFADAGDGAAWFVMLVTGILSVGVALWIEVNWQPAYWVHAVVAVPLTLGLPLLLLRPAKAILVCQQYRTKVAQARLSDQ